MHLQQELAVLGREVRRVEDHFAVEFCSCFDRACGWTDREGSAALTQDGTPREVGRVVEWVLQRHHATHACVKANAKLRATCT